MTDETPDVTARARAALDGSWEGEFAVHRLVCDLADEVERLQRQPVELSASMLADAVKAEAERDELRAEVDRLLPEVAGWETIAVDRADTIDRIDADLVAARAEVKRLRSNLNLVRRHRDAYLADRDEARAAVDRVRKLATNWHRCTCDPGPEGQHREDCLTWAADELDRALDGEA